MYSINQRNKNVESFLKGEILKPYEKATECFYLVIDKNENEEIKLEKLTNKRLILGEYFIEWRRKLILKHNNDDDDDNDEDDEESDDNKSEIFNVKTSIDLPKINIYSFPFLIEPTLPTHGYLNEPMTIKYKIKNQISTQVLDLDCTLDENEFFSISGKKLEIIQIMANDFKDYSYVVCPLQTGFCKLPNFHIKINNAVAKTSNLVTQPQLSTVTAIPDTDNASSNELSYDINEDLDSIIQNMIPSQIFIFPEKINI